MNNQIIFALDNLTDLATLLVGLPADTELHLLDASGDALAQMAQILQGRSDIAAIHLFSHGGPGSLNLGSLTLNAANLASHADALASIGAALTPTADWLIYGCDAAQGATGKAFVTALATLTGADVAASTNLTGSAALGGDWVLEMQAGPIEVQLPSSQLVGYLSTLPSLLVQTNLYSTDGAIPGGPLATTNVLTSATATSNNTGEPYFLLPDGGTVNLDSLKDGQLGGDRVVAASVFPCDVSITFSLDLTGRPDGYSIKSIKTYASWDNGRDGQEYTVQYATAADPTTFINIGSAARFNPTAFPVGDINEGHVYNATGGSGEGWYGQEGEFTPAVYLDGSLGYGEGDNWQQASYNDSNVTTLVQMTKSTGPLADNVVALRFVFTAFESNGTAYREIVVEETANATPMITNLNTDSVAWAGVGNSVALDASTALTISDAELDAANWSGAGLTVQRFEGSTAKPLVSDVFSFNASGFTVSGADLQTGVSTTFGTFTNTGGVLTISFNANATHTLVQDVMRGVLYRNDTPTGDTTVRFSLSDGTTAATAEVTVNLDQAAPSITSGATAMAIAENSGAGQVIYTAVATDPATDGGPSNPIIYALGGTDSVLFSIATSGAVTLTGNPDYETKNSYSFTVVATDAANNASSQAVTLAVTNVYEAPTITSGATATTIAENSSVAAAIYTAAAMKDATAGVLSFSLGGTDAARFAMDSVTGAVRLLASADYETKTSYSFSVQANDGVSESAAQAVTLAVTNVYEKPKFTSVATTAAVDENSSTGTVVYTASAFTDSTKPNELRFMMGGADGGLFNVSAAGEVTLKNSANYETKSSYRFNVYAGDLSNWTLSNGITLAINDVNEAPAVAAALTSTAAEGVASYDLNLLGGASDVDASDTLSVTAVTYKVNAVATGTAGADLPAGVTRTGATLSVDPNNAAFNHLAVGESMVIVASYTVSDSHSGTVAQTQTITITGTNDAATFSGASTAGVTEDNTGNFVKSGTLTVADVDSVTTVTAQTDTAGRYGAFSIAANGEWSYAADNAKLQALGGTTPTATDTFTVATADGTTHDIVVTLTGVNDAATFGGIDTASVSENSSDYVKTGTLTVSDVDSATTVLAQTDTQGNYGTFSITNVGAWTYTADNAKLQADGGSVAIATETFTVATADGTTHDIVVTLTGTNDAPVFSPAESTLTYAFGTPQVLNSTLTVYDQELARTSSPAGNYSGATLTLSRATNGAATPDSADQFVGLNGLILQGSSVTYGSTTVGAFTNTGGQLVITFNANATQERVNGVLQNIGYANVAYTRPLLDQPMTLQWRFSDQNTDAAQGPGGVQTGLKLTTVTLKAPVPTLTLSGTRGNDNLIGAQGADTLDGGAGVDALRGGEGSDLYLIGAAADHTAAEIVDIDIDGTPDIDEVRFTSTTSGQTLKLFAGDTGIENVVIGTGKVGPAVTSARTTLNVDASQVQNALMVTGNAGANSLIGTGFADTLTGGAGNDTLTGGTGNDTFNVDAGNDTVTDLATGDVLKVSSGATVTANNVAAFVATSATTIAGMTILNARSAGAVIDMHLAAGTAGYTLNGSMGTDQLVGSAGADTLTGGAGNDSLTGGASNDTFNVTAGSVTVTDLTTGDTLKVSAGASATASGLTGFVATAATTNAGTVSLNAASAGGVIDMRLAAGAKGFALSGGNGADTLIGSRQADTLTAGAGDDSLTGNAGIDTFLITNGKATLTDLGSGGAEVLRVSAGAILNATLAAAWTATNVSSNSGAVNITTSGYAVNLSAVTSGSSGFVINNRGAAAVLTGSALADTITGGAGNDVLSGGGGTDQLNGAAGSDLYLFGSATEHTAAEIADSGSSGTDEMRFTSVISGQTLTLFAEDAGVEQVVIGTGTAAKAVSSGTTGLNVDATAASNGLTLIGNAGANSLTGTAYIDNIQGGAGNDTLKGGAGNDTLTGGTGNDTFNVDAGNDTVTDLATGDVLKVSSGATVTANNVAAFVATSATTIAGMTILNAHSAGGVIDMRLAAGTQGIALNGGARADTLRGGGGADTLVGAAGKDVLTGGLGSDTFVFNFLPTSNTDYDTITDFVKGVDKLEFSLSIFTSLAGRTIEQSLLVGAGLAKASTADQHLIYNTTSGMLYYDADGSGAGRSAVAIALIGTTTHPALAATDLLAV